MAPASKVVIRLTDQQRQTLQTLVRTGTHKAHARTRAHILIRADADGPDPWPDERIAEALASVAGRSRGSGSSSPPRDST